MFGIYPRVSAGKLAFIAAGFAALAIFLFYQILDSEKRILPRTELASTSGRVTWVAKHKREIRFTLAGHPQTFRYSAKTNGLSAVNSRLSSADKSEVLILFDPQPIRRWLPKSEYHTVWEIVTPSGPVRTLLESQDAVRADNEIGRWIAGFFAVIAAYSAYFLYITWRRYNAQFIR